MARKIKMPPVNFKDGDIVRDDDLGVSCPKCAAPLDFEPGDGSDIKISASCCNILYVGYPSTWKMSVDEI